MTHIQVNTTKFYLWKHIKQKLCYIRAGKFVPTTNVVICPTLQCTHESNAVLNFLQERVSAIIFIYIPQNQTLSVGYNTRGAFQMFSLKSFVLVFCGFTQRYVKYSVPLKKLQLNFLFEIKVVTASNLTQFKILCIWRPMIFGEERTTNPKDIQTSSSITVRFAIDHHLRPDVDDVTKHRLVQYVFMDLTWIYGPRTNWCVLKNQLLWIWILVLSFSWRGRFQPHWTRLLFCNCS